MKNITDKLQTLFPTFRAKLLFAFFTCILLPLSVIGFMLYTVTYRIASDRIMDSAILADDQLNVQINNRLDQTENVADSIQYNMYTLSSIDNELSEYIPAFNEVRNNIYLYKTTFGFRHIYVFLPEEQMGASEGLYFMPLSKLYDFPLMDSQLENPGTSSIWFFQKNSELPFILDTEEVCGNSIACCRILKNQSTGEIDYAYIILLNPDELSDILENTFSDSRITSYLVSPEGQIMAHTSKNQCGTFLTDEKITSITTASINHEDSIYIENGIHYHTVTLDNGWYHVTEIPEGYVGENTFVLLKTIIIAFVIIIPLTLFMILLFSKNLTKRVLRLSNAMENFRLDKQSSSTVLNLIPANRSPELYDEIDKLGLTFMNMQSSLNENMQSILDLSLSEEKLKYQLLQSQINPHFLYNILGTIKTCQSIGKLDIAEQMITDLTMFYRLSLRKSSDKIAIRDELEIARLYLDMEKLCHSENLSWEIHAEDGIENFLICRFTLQPFLENSILHGYSRTVTHLHIKVDVMYGDDDVIITITDDGIGIEPEQLQELHDTLDQKIVNYEKHFGIGNVNKRISSPSFGNGSVQIDSTPGKGTCITICFEQMEE